jgi:Holliday junction resolvase RusA-like endonuclease
MITIPPNNIANYGQWGLEIKQNITFCLKLPYFFTGNLMYRAVHRGGKTWMRKVDEVTHLQDAIIEQVKALEVEIKNKDSWYTIHAAFTFNKLDWVTNEENTMRRIDLTNLWKPIEDAISKALGIDDSKCVLLVLSKCLLPYTIKTPPYPVNVDMTLLG